MQHLQFFSFLQSAGSRALQLSAVNRAWCSVDFLWVSAWLKGFFPPHWRCFFPLHFTFRLLRRCCWSGPFRYHYSQFLSRLEALKPGFFQHLGFGFWLCMLNVGNLQMFDLDPFDMVKNQTHSQFPEGIRIHRIISPNRADELPIERWTPSRNMCFWLCKSIKTSGCKPSLRP